MSLHCRITSIYKEVIKISGPCLSFCSPNTPDRILGSSLILQKINFSICCRWLIVQRYTFAGQILCGVEGQSTARRASGRKYSLPFPVNNHSPLALTRKSRFPKENELWQIFGKNNHSVKCKTFASGVNFFIFTHFLCFFPLKLLKLGEIDGVKFLAWKIRQCKFLDKFHVYICLC